LHCNSKYYKATPLNPYSLGAFQQHPVLIERKGVGGGGGGIGFGGFQNDKKTKKLP